MLPVVSVAQDLSDWVVHRRHVGKVDPRDLLDLIFPADRSLPFVPCRRKRPC